MHRIFRVKAYEQEHGPHFDEVMAHKAVSKMENEDGSRGPHWSIEETTALASQHGISLSNRFNRYDWYVALNMIYSDFYKVIVSISNSNNVRHFIEFAKAWLADKDIDEGKMWYYYVYVMCDKIRKAVNTALNQINAGVSQISCDTKLSSCQVINAIQSGNAGLASQLASCCCDVRTAIQQQGYENQLAIVNQTNTLTSNANTQFNILGAKIDAQTQIINDKFCQLEMREMQNKIDTLRADKASLEAAALTQAQTANLINQLRPCPVPAYLTCNPQFLYLKFMMNLYHRVSSQCLINQEKEQLTLLFNATENRRSSQFQRTDPLLLIIILD